MNVYNFILEASSFEKGLGNIKRWCENKSDNVKLRIYIPTYTLRELDFQRYKFKSFMARESLKFIEYIEDRNSSPKYHSDSLEIIIELPDFLDLVLWREVLEIAGEEHEEKLNKLPRRLKNLLKSCVHLCHLHVSDDYKWILISEDNQVKELARICKIPIISIVDADSALARDMNKKSFKMSENFNKQIIKNGVAEETKQGKKIVKTNFDNTVYASRGNGVLWAP
ncbi:hypothetical protein Kpol_1042p23 [Vanderwaltozyma polyspora DSM 70294]|uniref:PIN domain-containing protein n=1 Tax=Vanderwaltozyma polyspora (strain ATCC 22028 / DSM 70294 / BCRC 21397 / CBS 2163 / NBRC 10782 / NRRL Y-8283 / UCD 57-17) TaxID=436907 RepID=A7TQA8_VANPO|nr:uncharacterized protein Kpol_1042p23 [Vanderwaltozyma polyspora DSM 70294]EDO15562.1 hypothetical protein Kpol_1042p23 [Vanderwaltozyma polyspora DSM 70294]